MTTPQNKQIPEDILSEIDELGILHADVQIGDIAIFTDTPTLIKWTACHEDFTAGATHYAALLVEEREKAMRWVKATERLPEKSGAYFCKDLKYNRRKIGYYTVGTVQGRNSLFKTRPWDVEWLDEPTTSQALKEGDKTGKEE